MPHACALRAGARGEAEPAVRARQEPEEAVAEDDKPQHFQGFLDRGEEEEAGGFHAVPGHVFAACQLEAEGAGDVQAAAEDGQGGDRAGQREDEAQVGEADQEREDRSRDHPAEVEDALRVDEAVDERDERLVHPRRLVIGEDEEDQRQPGPVVAPAASLAEGPHGEQREEGRDADKEQVVEKGREVGLGVEDEQARDALSAAGIEVEDRREVQAEQDGEDRERRRGHQARAQPEPLRGVAPRG